LKNGINLNKKLIQLIDKLFTKIEMFGGVASASILGMKKMEKMIFLRDQF
jgi:hypothetical protein